MKSLARTKQLQESLAAAPSSSRWLRDNVYDAPAFQDDTPLMAQVESSIKEIGSSIADGFADIPKGFEAGLLVAEQGGAWADLGDSAPSEDFLAEDKKRDEEMKALQGDEPGMLWHAAQVLGTMFGSVEQGVAGGGAAASLAAGAMATGAIPVAGQAFAAAGAVGTMAYGTYRIEGGLSVKENYEATQDYDKARLIGNGVGFLNSLVESIGLHVLGKAAKPVLDPLIAKFSPKAVTALENLTVRQALTGAAKSLALGAGQEVVTEVVQEVNSIMGEELAKAWSGIDSDLTAEAFVDRLREVAINTAQAMVVLGGLSAGPVLHANLKKVNRAKENKEKLAEVIDRFKQMKAAQTSPEAAEELLDAQAADAGVSHVWVDAQALQQAMINAGVTKQDLEQVLPEAASQIDEASAVGGDVVLPTARYASALGGTELGTVLSDHIRLERNGLSNAEALQVEQSLKQMRVDLINEQIAPTSQEQAEIDAIQNDQTKTPEQKTAEITELAARRKADNDARKAYEDSIVAQMEGSNFTRYQARTQAKLAGSIVSNLARRLNIPVQDAVNRYGVSVAVSDAGPTGNKFNMPITQGKEWNMGPKSFDPETRLRAIEIENAPLERAQAIEQGTKILSKGVRNESSGFVLTASRSDMKKSAGKIGSNKELLFANVVRDIERIAREAIFVESFATGKKIKVAGKESYEIDKHVKGVHKFASPVLFDNELWRVELVVKDYRSGDRSAVHSIDGIYLEKIERPPIEITQPDGGLSPSGNTAVSHRQDYSASDGPSGFDVTLTEFLDGVNPYIRADGRHLFDEVDAAQGQEGGVYYEEPELNQRYGSGVLGSYAPSENRITLTPNANLSTFSHEIGHWYMETLIDVVRRGNAPASVNEDVQALFKEFGVADVAAWDALGFEGQRKYHERFASWTEQYLAEGRAPVGLKRFFMNLGRWIRDAYREFTGGVTEATRARYRQEIGEELPELSDEVRMVLDRMVASERAVEEAQAAESLHPLFDSKPADMTDVEWDFFLRARAMATEEGMSELVERQAKDDKWYANKRAALMREKGQEAKAFRERIREKVERKVNGQKEFVARDILSTGGAKFGFDNLKIDPASVRELGFADRTIAKLQTMGVLKKGGMTVAQTRELLNPMARFSSDKQLIRGLLDTENRERIIEDQTTTICLARRSDLFNPADLDRAITAALHNEARARVVATELKYLTGTQTLISAC